MPLSANADSGAPAIAMIADDALAHATSFNQRDIVRIL
jgi:hypothetical protein